MITKEITTNQINEKYIVDKHLLFKYQLVKREIVGKSIHLVFEIDDTMPQYEELMKLEKEYGNFHIRSLIPIFILPIIAIILITAFFIVYFVNKDAVEYMTLFLSMMLPALIILFIAVLAFGGRIFRIAKYEKEKENRDKTYRDKIDQLFS